VTTDEVHEADGCVPVLAVAALMSLGPLAVPVVLFILLGAGVVGLVLAGYEMLRNAFRPPTDQAAHSSKLRGARGK